MEERQECKGNLLPMQQYSAAITKAVIMLTVVATGSMGLAVITLELAALNIPTIIIVILNRLHMKHVDHMEKHSLVQQQRQQQQ